MKYDSNMCCSYTGSLHDPSGPLQMMLNVDGHSWALCAVNDEMPAKIFTALNKELIPITDSPVVVQQHNIPPQKFVLLSAKVNIFISSFTPVFDQLWWCLVICHLTFLQGSHIFQKLRPVDQLRHLSVSCAGGESEEIERFFKLHRVFLLFIPPSFHGFTCKAHMSC